MADLGDVGFTVVWATLLAYWVWNSRNVKRTRRTEPVFIQLIAYWAPLAIACVLLGPDEWFEGSPLTEPLVPKLLWVKWAGLLLAAAGVCLACWSRQVLGCNWSSVVQLKHDHELIDYGPYRYVRHPIYTGLLLAFIGTALKVGDWRGLIAVAMVLVSFWCKLRVEERWLMEHFGPSYATYKYRTKALVPGVI